MKKLFAIIAIAGFITACNNEAETETTDVDTVTTDTSTMMSTDTTMIAPSTSDTAAAGVTDTTAH